MKRIILFLFLMGCGTIAFSQGLIGKTPAKVKRDLDRHLAKTKVSATYEQTDTSLTLQIRDPKYQPVDFIFRFENKRCVEELRVGCDSCVNKYLEEALQVKVYGWTKVNESSYVSKRSYRRMMVVMKEPSSLVIRRMKWSRDEYEAALARKQKS